MFTPGKNLENFVFSTIFIILSWKIEGILVEFYWDSGIFFCLKLIILFLCYFIFKQLYKILKRLYKIYSNLKNFIFYNIKC